MRDMNFFSVYKKARAKNRKVGLVVTLIIFLILLLNAGLVGGGLWQIMQIQLRIAQLQVYISNPETIAGLTEIKAIQDEGDIAAKYLQSLTSLDHNLRQLDHINTPLLDAIRQLTPPSVTINSARYADSLVSLTCSCTDPAAAMDMLHAFRTSPYFAHATMSSITMLEGIATFSINGLLEPPASSATPATTAD